MRRLLCLLVLGAPAIAFSQPYDPGSATPPPPASPPPSGPYNGAPGPYTPPPPQGPPQQPQPYGPQPQPYYGQPQPYAQPEPPTTAQMRTGMTFEANLGIGWLRLAANGESDTSDLGIGGLCLGLGGWVGSKMAITGRISGVTLRENGESFSGIFAGPSLQYWVDDHFWFGGGLGFAIASSSTSDETANGFGLDARIGYTFTAGTENTFNASMELTPGFFNENDVDYTLTGISFMLGYQHL